MWKIKLNNPRKSYFLNYFLFTLVYYYYNSFFFFPYGLYCFSFNPMCLSMFENTFKKTFSAVLKRRPRSPIRIIDPESVAVLVKRVRITKSGADQDFSVEESSDGLSDGKRIIRKFSFDGFRRVDGDDGLDVRQAAVAANQVNRTLKR